MAGVFDIDFFSNNVPVWTPISGVEALLSFLRGAFLDSYDFSNVRIHHSGAYEINSSNFKINLTGETFLLKRWSPKSDYNTIEKTVELMAWIAGEQLPVPSPLKFKNDRFIATWDGYLWSYFPFIEGKYFMGSLGELNEAAIITGRLTQHLSKIPQSIHPDDGPQHLTEQDDLIIQRMNGSRKSWRRIFGQDDAQLLDDKWDELRNDWVRLKSSRLQAGPVAPVHFDLHPHNLLVDGSRITGVLDFESCKQMPIGYALAFSALKQCRQAVVYSQGQKQPELIGRSYVKTLSEAIKGIEPCFPCFADLALAEVLRRLCIIFRLNLDENNNVWNKVLPIQLNHLAEAKILFNQL